MTKSLLSTFQKRTSAASSPLNRPHASVGIPMSHRSPQVRHPWEAAPQRSSSYLWSLGTDRLRENLLNCLCSSASSDSSQRSSPCRDGLPGQPPRSRCSRVQPSFVKPLVETKAVLDRVHSLGRPPRRS
ncbi:hypothetical protein VDGL01_12210 [Verticillium dahliae]